MGALRGKLRKKHYILENESILRKIQDDYGVRIDYDTVIKHFNDQRIAFYTLFSKLEPTALLISQYYGINLPAVKAAKDLGVKVIEAQHGVIGRDHPAYNIGTGLDRTYFPDYLLVFGERELETFDNSLFIEPRNVYPVGSYYIDYINNEYLLDSDLVSLLTKFHRSIGITLQWVWEKRMIEFVRSAAVLDSSIGYILIPRQHFEKDYSSFNLPDNVMVAEDKDFYQLMKYVDFHATVESTCALEAPSLGVQNIMVNIDNKSRERYGEVLNDSRITSYADTPEEFVRLINTFEIIDRDTVASSNEDIIAVNYTENIRNFIEKHLKS